MTGFNLPPGVTELDIEIQSGAVEQCAQCGRSTCPLLADIITGTANWIRAVADCLRAQGGR